MPYGDQKPHHKASRVVLAVILVLAFGAVALIANLASPRFTILGREVTGATAAITLFALAGLCAVLAVQLYRLKESAWWTLILLQLAGVGIALTIGRDHLDAGSVASPNRETEGMKDGSDAIADWPILNALLNTAAGATWVSLHHGGGVGIGYSLHAGMVIVADGTDAAAARLERVLMADPGTGVMRHADAGYEEAIKVARERGVDVPMMPPR